MRAAQFERLASLPREGVLSAGHPDPLAARPATPPVVASGLAVELWDALRDCIGALLRRVPRAREGSAGGRYG
ncbi:MAG TPA: hypothetical protein VKK19_11595 [Candidatus Dormibacteraeota bacterium]|nr:hypothetical protein [Candidatus Dormibacteraeota bacterium]